MEAHLCSSLETSQIHLCSLWKTTDLVRKQTTPHRNGSTFDGDQPAYVGLWL
jgi:hypothetical protein